MIKDQGYYLRNSDERGNAHAAVHPTMINQFLELVYLSK
jgi:hypothetical protein